MVDFPAAFDFAAPRLVVARFAVARLLVARFAVDFARGPVAPFERAPAALPFADFAPAAFRVAFAFETFVVREPAAAFDFVAAPLAFEVALRAPAFTFAAPFFAAPFAAFAREPALAFAAPFAFAAPRFAVALRVVAFFAVAFRAPVFALAFAPLFAFAEPFDFDRDVPVDALDLDPAFFVLPRRSAMCFLPLAGLIGRGLCHAERRSDDGVV